MSYSGVASADGLMSSRAWYFQLVSPTFVPPAVPVPIVWP
jgi:tryptophan-rich sensory protein